MLAMDLAPSPWAKISAEKKDRKRLHDAECEATIEAKKRRQSLTFEKQTCSCHNSGFL